MQACLRPAERWRLRLRTAKAIGLLCRARLLVDWVPFEYWRRSLEPSEETHPDTRSAEARSFAAHVERAAALVPFHTKCLPRAAALSWMLRGTRISYSTVVAVRPVGMRNAADRLHAWVEVDGQTIIGDLPGPWVETLRLGGGAAHGAI